ncbi:hypothetical protein CHELA41_21488 [Hyphomicrobiales bacterium]|nr:hypothetical protein CHELA41_21488 [Hyphomicrobiales bacterium]
MRVSASPVTAAASTRASRSARFPTAKVSSVCSRSTRRTSIPSRSSAAARCVAPSSTICVTVVVSPPVSPSAPIARPRPRAPRQPPPSNRTFHSGRRAGVLRAGLPVFPLMVPWDDPEGTRFPPFFLKSAIFRGYGRGMRHPARWNDRSRLSPPLSWY